jgi:ribonuclease VapC
VKTELAYALDSFALLAHLQAEPGGARVGEVLAQALTRRVTVYLSLVNYGEAIYITEREQGLTAAQTLIATVDQLPIQVVEADRPRVLAAAHLKAHYPFSARLAGRADAFAVALAQEKQAILLTGDPEFRRVETFVTIEWLPLRS